MVKDCLINQGAVIKGTISHCVVSSDVIVEEGAECHNCVLMNGAHVRAGAKVYDALIAPGETIKRGEIVNGERDGIVLFAGGRATK